MRSLTAVGRLDMNGAARNLGDRFLRRSGWGWLVLLVIALMAPCSARAQEFRATISGTVTDVTAAVVPGASVEVRETQTGTISRTTSDSAGLYVVPFLLPGEYSITAKKAGFETYKRSGITLQAQEHPIVNLILTVGSASQTVTVTSEAPLVDQENASIGAVISTQSVADLPLNGRTPTVLSELSVGVITTGAPQLVHPFDNNAGNMWSMGGTPMQTSEVLLDGSPDLTMLGAQAYSPSQDSVQEVSVRPFDTDASFGHTIGGVINQITKGGTNTLHGTMYEFGQISNLDADLYLNKRATPMVKTPVTHFNQYGFTVGGPVLFPKIFNGKDKLFFFFSWEGLKDSTPASTLMTVPTDQEKAGDFSALLSTTGTGTPGGTGYQLYEPGTGTQTITKGIATGYTSRTAVPNNCLTNTTANNSNCGSEANAGITIDPVAVAYMKLFPEPNYKSGVSSALNQSNYLSQAPSIDKFNNEFGRLDYNLNTKDHVFFDFRHNYRTQIKNNYFSNNATGTTLARENWGSTLDNVYTVNPSTVVDVRVNWTFFNEIHGTPAQAYTPASVGLPASLGTSGTESQLPNIQFGGNSNSGSCGSFTSYTCLGDNTSALDPTTSYQVFGDVVKLLGKQTLKIGFDGRRYQLKVQNFGDSSGEFTFSPAFMLKDTGDPVQKFGADLASFEYGLPYSGEYDLNARADYRSYYVGAFVQDDWRINSHLTVNAGIRFDIDTAPGEKLGRTVNGFDPLATNTASSAASAAFGSGVSQTVNGTTVALTSMNSLGGLTFPGGKGGAPFQTNKGYFSPRVGFSYNPALLHSKIVVRGGFGVFVMPETLSSLSATAGTYSSNALNNQEGFSASTAFVATVDSYFDAKNASTLDNPFPSGFVQPSGSKLGASTFLGSPSAINFLAPKQHDSYSERWNLGVQHSITSNTLVEVLYVGNHAVHLPVASQNINAVEKQYMTTNPYTDYDLNSATSAKVNNPFSGLLPNGSSTFNGSTTALSNLLVPYPQFGNTAITEQNETIGQSWFHSGLAHIEHRAKNGLTLTANYGFSKLIEADSRLNDEDNFLTHRVSPLDHTHHFTVGGTYNLPFGRDKKFTLGGGRLADEIAGGWVLNAIYQFQTGPPVLWATDIPFNPGYGIKDIKSKPRDTKTGIADTAIVNAYTIFATGSASGYKAKSKTVLNTTTCAISACDGTVSTYDPTAGDIAHVAATTSAAYPNHYRTLPQTISSVRADGYNNLDASILKNFNFSAKSFFQLRFETFNTLNHAVFAQPIVSSPTKASFGFIQAVASNSQPRQVQIGGRIVF